MKTLILLHTLTLALYGCSEPDRRVMDATVDGRFVLSLKAKRNQVRPGDELPVRVEVESVRGPLKQTLVETVEFAVNNGSVDPPRLSATFFGTADSLAEEANSTYGAWIVFTASSRASSEDQGEIHALFLDALATLKLRIVPAPEDL